MVENNTNEKITKIGISSPEDLMFDSSFTYEFLDSLTNKNTVKTISWFEYESM